MRIKFQREVLVYWTY